MTTEARQHHRIDIRISAEVTPPEGLTFTCITRDLSLGGLGLECDRPLQEGAHLYLELFVVFDDIEDEATQPIPVRGKVVWSRIRDQETFLAGIQFLAIDDHSKKQIHRLIAAQR